MPFTFSHPAAVLPLRYLPKKWFSLTGLVIGSMVPDFEYFIRMKVESIYSHTWPGLFWFDLPLALALMLIYNALIKNRLIDHLPIFLNRRFSDFKNTSKVHSKYLVIIISILIGAASHILWDDFTHPTGYFVLHTPILKHPVFMFHHKFLLYNILQQLSSLIGALIILVAIWLLPLGKSTAHKPIIYYWLIVAAIAVIIIGIRLFTGLAIKQYGDIIVTAISGLLIGLIVVSIVTKKASSTVV